MIRIAKLQHFVPLINKFFSPFAIYRFPLPDLGEKIKEGKVKKMYVKEGDRVSEFQKLADVESDKQFTEITAPEEGVVKKLYYQEDQTCQVGDVFLEIQTDASQTPSKPPKTSQTSSQPQSQPTEPASESKPEILASATVEFWARNHGIDLKDVQGTGRKGRILKGDVIYYLQNNKSSQKRPIEGKVVKQSQSPQPHKVQKIQMDDTQKLMYRLATYTATVPHLYFQQLFDVSILLSIVEQNQNNKPKISLLSLFIKAFSLALKENPKINSIYSPDKPFEFRTVAEQNLLLPIYSNEGLSFMNIGNVQKQSIWDIQQKIQQTKPVSQATKIKDLISQSSICLSNVSDVGVLTMNPPILGQMVCHASLGQIREVPISINNVPHKKQYMSVVIGADHRVIDGGSAARFVMKWKQYSQNPNRAFLQMI